MDMLPVYRPSVIATAERILLGGDEVAVLATSAQTGGALFAVQMRMPPGGGPPVMHRHVPGEVYHVLEGEFAFYVGGADGRGNDGIGAVRRFTARAGEVVPLAGGVPHTIRNESAADAVAFVVHAPGAPMEGFSRAAAALAANGVPTMDAVLAIAAENGIELLGPVPAGCGSP
jgi:mannose-6-phosphate isomerase-like protein (cupin superfamily)